MSLDPITYISRLDSDGQVILPPEILERKRFPLGGKLGFQIDEQNVVTLVHIDRPILNLAGAGTGLYEGFDLAKDREES
jgi:hypothetical protein